MSAPLGAGDAVAREPAVSHRIVRTKASRPALPRTLPDVMDALSQSLDPKGIDAWFTSQF